MTRFQHALYFTSANEDGDSEILAFSGRPFEKILCLTASGARPLDLLLSPAETIEALDINPAQNHLLALKIAAMKNLEATALYQFLGLEPSENRLSLYRHIAPDLNAATRDFFDRQQKAIRDGILFSGKWERALKAAASILKLCHPKAQKALFKSENVAQQIVVWEKYFMPLLGGNIMRFFAQKWIWANVMGEPGGHFLPTPIKTQEIFSGRLHQAAGQFLFRDSPFLSLMFFGHWPSPDYHSPHLRPRNLDKVRARLGAITIKDGNLKALEKGVKYDGFSLSDFGSYVGQYDYDDMWRAILGAAQKGALFVERQFLNPLLPSAEITRHIAQDDRLQNHLNQSDNAAIYTFSIGRII